jgi:hypothetical protein
MKRCDICKESIVAADFPLHYSECADRHEHDFISINSHVLHGQQASSMNQHHDRSVFLNNYPDVRQMPRPSQVSLL